MQNIFCVVQEIDIWIVLQVLYELFCLFNPIRTGGGPNRPPPWYWSPAVLWKMQVWTPNFLTILILIPLKPLWRNFLKIFKDFFENWPRTTRTQKFLVLKKRKNPFFLIFTMKNLKYYFKIHWQFFWGFFWGIARFCRSKNDDFRNASWFRDIFTKNA